MTDHPYPIARPEDCGPWVKWASPKQLRLSGDYRKFFPGSFLLGNLCFSHRLLQRRTVRRSRWLGSFAMEAQNLLLMPVGWAPEEGRFDLPPRAELPDFYLHIAPVATVTLCL